MSDHPDVANKRLQQAGGSHYRQYCTASIVVGLVSTLRANFHVVDRIKIVGENITSIVANEKNIEIFSHSSVRLKLGKIL